MDPTQLEQEKVVKPIEEMLPKRISKQACLERRAIRAQKEEAFNCPRCNSTNTKFCYYNNYSLSQPRYFCKTCRRYWTEGGSLRNIPFGGGPRKNKRSSYSTSSLSVSNTKLPHLVQPPPPPQSTSPGPKIREGNDLNLAFPSHDFEAISGLIQVPNFDNKTPTSSFCLPASELLAGFNSKGMNNSCMPMQMSDQNTIYPSGFSLQEFKPTLDCSLGGLGSGGCGNLQGLEETSASFLFPFEDLKKQVSNTSVVEQNRKQGDTSGYWNGVLGGGSWCKRR